MAIIGYSPWTDAANYGRGLGDTLGQAMLQMPLQRQMIRQQAEQAQAQQQQEMLKYALQKSAQEQQYRMGMIEQGTRGIEYNKQLEELKHQTALQQLRLGAENKKAEMSVIEPKYDKDGNYLGHFDYNQKTFVPAEQPTNQLGSVKPVIPMTENQRLNNVINGSKALGMFNQTGQNTNLPAIFNLLSNAVMQAGQPRLGAVAPQPQQQMPTAQQGLPDFTGQPAATNTPIQLKDWLQQNQ